MSDREWDDESFEAPVGGKPVVSDKWEGEDEDEEVRDNWDDEDEQEKKDGTASADASAVQIKKKKTLKDRLAEKEEKRKKELEEKRKQEEELKKLTPKQLFEEKLRRQLLQEAADLELAVEAFGFKKEEPSFGVIDGFDPKTKEEFDKFCQMLCEKITKFDKSPYYVPFMENLVRDLTLGVGAEDLKKVSSTLTALYNEKVKLLKGTKGKKKTKKATLFIEKDGVTGADEGTRFENEFDDYL